ncbi:hypothetical protein [Rhizobium phage RHph_X2_30]|nr:hypothetical protein [Rhizobium phage RHph_X2_30]
MATLLCNYQQTVLDEIRESYGLTFEQMTDRYHSGGIVSPNSASEISFKVDQAQRRIDREARAVNIVVTTEMVSKLLDAPRPRTADMQSMMDDIDRYERTPVTRHRDLIERVRQVMVEKWRKNSFYGRAGR